MLTDLLSVDFVNDLANGAFAAEIEQLCDFSRSPRCPGWMHDASLEALLACDARTGILLLLKMLVR